MSDQTSEYGQPAAQPDFDAAVQAEVQRQLAEREAQQPARPPVPRSAPEELYTRGYDGPHAWEIAEAHSSPDVHAQIDPQTGRPRRRPVAYTGPGAVTHSEPILTCGSADSSTGGAVTRLVDLLAGLGYHDSRDERTAAAGVLDTSVMAAVQRFCADYGTGNDVQEYQGREVPAAKLVGEHVGPYIWQALHAVTAAQHDAA